MYIFTLRGFMGIFDSDFRGQQANTQLLETSADSGSWAKAVERRSIWKGDTPALGDVAHGVGAAEKLMGSAMVAIGAAIILAAPPAAAIGLQLMTAGAVCFGLGAATKAGLSMGGHVVSKKVKKNLKHNSLQVYAPYEPAREPEYSKSI